MDFLVNNLWIAWMLAIIVFIVIEAVTTGLTSIWFAVGALAALIGSLFGAVLWLQVLLFIVVSGIALYFTKPFAEKFNKSHQATNADMLIGMEGYVSEKIDNIAGTGAVTVAGKVWTARAEDEDARFDVGAVVETVRIEGVKLIVRAAAEDNN